MRMRLVPWPSIFRAHGDQHLGQVGNFGLLGGVFQHGLALGQRGGHEEVLGARHGDHVGGDACALQARAPAGSLAIM
jgi:hypothetical protein